MNYYVIVYLFSVVFSSISGILIFKRYQNIAGFFFLLFTLFLSIWCSAYFLFFSGIEDVNILLFLSRLDFGISLPLIFSFFLFIKHFRQGKWEIFTKKTFAILATYVGILTLYLSTNWAVAGLEFSQTDHVYREIYGPLYFVHIIISVAFLPLFLFYAFKQLKTQTILNRIRFRNIILAAFVVIFVALIFQIILPALEIWLFEKELIFLLTFFVVYIFFTLRRYYFSSGYELSKAVIIILSVNISIILLNVIRWICVEMRKTGSLTSYWDVQDSYFVLNTVIGIVIFSIAYQLLKKIFPGGTYKSELEKKIQRLEQWLSYTTNLNDLNDQLAKGIGMIFKTKLAKIQLWSHENKGELKQYFENDLSDKIFINDVVFIEEKKTKFNKSRLLSEISGDTFLILPFFDNSGEKNIGIFTLGTKSFGDFYTIEEIGVLRGFSIFLERQIQYIKTYGLLKDLSLNLDKKVDEKTMEFNNLINRQKEFISMISHEVRAPIANAIFQADSIIDDMDKNALSRKEMKSEMDILNSQLIKAGELVTKLFSMQYFDTRSVELFKEQIQIADFLEAEYKVYARMHPEIRFIDLIDRTIKFVLIDRVQFQQVISNILQNAMKHLNTVEPKIAIEAFKKDGNLVIIIEDNGPGFIGINTSQLFDRYTTGKGEFVSLGMGLYLCKKIVEMHDGTIVAEESEKLSWAKFTITIPLC